MELDDKNTDWIDTSKKLPSLHEYVLSCNQNGEICISAIIMQDKLGNFLWLSQMDNEKEKITHWMPLPKPPKKEENS